MVSRHHGQQHINVIPIAKLVEWAGVELPQRYIKHNLTNNGNEAVEAVAKVVIINDHEIRVVMVSGGVVTASGCSPRMMSEMRKAWPDAEDLRKESPDDPSRSELGS